MISDCNSWLSIFLYSLIIALNLFCRVGLFQIDILFQKCMFSCNVCLCAFREDRFLNNNSIMKIKNNILLAYQTIYFYNFVFYCNKY
ncbi:hypothetical protein GPL10_16625 [Bacteroides fragilis]|nr:hypothetical protein [Bacteroides fragilis]RDT74339.1 hypothetical protein DWS34_18920 [Bacteroides fragilis]